MLSGFATVMATLALSASAPTAAEWESDYGKALTQTRSDSRPLLVVMDKPGVAAEQVPAELLKPAGKDSSLAKYDLCHVDVSTEYGRAVAKAFKATQFPYFAIIDKSGSVVLHRHAGVVTAQGWNAALAKHQSGDRAQRITVAKPVVSESGAVGAPVEATSPVAVEAQPATYGANYFESTPSSYYSTPVRSYCPNCQRR